MNRAKSLIKRFSYPEDKIGDSLVLFLERLNLQASKLAPATRRQYRSAVRFYFLQEHKIDILEDWPDFLTSPVDRAQLRKEFGKRTSALKSKHMNSNHLYALLNYLEASTSRNAFLVRNILLASEFFGLRPFEWGSANWVYNQRLGLRVKNAKYSQERSHGRYRTIWTSVSSVEEATSEELQSIQAAELLITYFSSMSGGMKQVERELFKARQYLSQLYRTNVFFKKQSKYNRITLYSARHQFAANAKKAGLSSTEIAALMGHGSTLTSQESYGRRSYGNGRKFSVKPDERDIENVMLKMTENTKQSNLCQ